LARFQDSFPIPSLPVFSLERIQAVLPDGIAIALLGAIESLLSAVVADGMTGRRHRSNCELSAQGVANIVSIVFGGICVTGTVARTATNLRAGARGPVSGIFHCGYLLIFLLIGAPLAGYVPLAALRAVLAVVAWNMAEKEEFWSLLRSSRGDAVVLLATFLLTIFVDLITGIAVGVVLGGQASKWLTGDPRSQRWPTMSTRASGTMPGRPPIATSWSIKSAARFSSVLLRESWACLIEWEHRGCLCWISRTSR
ncbi:MAG: SulP family inorganic anion transporter, partial [Pseudolabrys sp.]